MRFSSLSSSSPISLLLLSPSASGRDSWCRFVWVCGGFFCLIGVYLCCWLEVDLFVEWMAGNERNFFADQFGDLIQVFHFFGFTKHNCVALESCSSRSSDTVDVHFRFEWNIVDDNMTQFVNVDSSCGDICRDENTDRTVF